MAKRTTPSDADHVVVADDMQTLVKDKREGWRANSAKARRRQRHYHKLIVDQLMKSGTGAIDDDDLEGRAVDD